jgi:hypothetical protein
MMKNICVSLCLVAIIVLFATLGLSLAATRGALAMSPIYDDCAYLLDAYRRLAFDGVNSVFDAAVSFYKEPPHAPVETASIMIGYSLFGGRDVGPYIFNIWGLSVYTASIFYVTSRRLAALPSILWTTVMMFVPAAGAIMTELRPDMVAGVLFAIAAYFLIAFRYDRASVKQTIAIGLLAAFALIVKPTALIITLPMLGFAWVIGIAKGSLLASAPKASMMVASSLAIIIPFAAVWGAQTVDYVYAVFFTNGDIWVTPGSALFQWTYNSIGPGGEIGLNKFIYIGAVVISFDILRTVVRNDWRESYTAVSFYVWTGIIYAGIAANSQKSPYQGSFFYFPFAIALTIAASRLLTETGKPMRFIVPALVVVAIFFPPATTYQDARQRPETLTMLDQMEGIIAQTSMCKGTQTFASVGPYPITPEAAALRAAKNGIPVEIRPLFLVRDRSEFMSRALSSNIVAFPNAAGRQEAEAQRLPGLSHMDALFSKLNGDPLWKRIPIDAGDPSFVFVKIACLS